MRDRPILPLKRRHIFTMEEVTTMVAVLRVLAETVDFDKVPLKLTNEAEAILARCKATQPGDWVRVDPGLPL